MDVQVPCRKCGKKAPSSEFTIDPDLKMAICKACANERKIAKSSIGSNPSVRNLPNELPKAQPRSPVLNQPVSNTPSGLGITLKSSTPSASKPAGWDETDELIEKAAMAKAVSKAPASEGGNIRTADGRIMHSCSKCKYQFKYDPDDDRPNKCPYCGTPTKGLFRR